MSSKTRWFCPWVFVLKISSSYRANPIAFAKITSWLGKKCDKMPNSNHWLQATIHSWMGTMVSKNAFALKKNHPELHFSCARYYFCSTKADQKSFGPLDGLLVDKRYFQSRSTGILGTNAKTRIGADTQCSTKCTCFQTVEGLYILNRKVGSILLVSGQTSSNLEFYEGV